MRVPNQWALFNERNIVWFSCGVASACAAKLAVRAYQDVHVVYCDTSKDEHPDNMRFLRDVENWIGQDITIIHSLKYSSIDDVFTDTRYMSGISGAKCTTEMKKIPRHHYEIPGDIHIFGYTADEKKRIDRFEVNNPELYLSWILRDAELTKADCFEMVRSAGIELPAMYKLGFKNNNCLGCVKATSPGYWNMTRQNFPDVFAKRAMQSRELGVRLVRVSGERIFLDELQEANNEAINDDLSCGPQCGIESMTEGE